MRKNIGVWFELKLLQRERDWLLSFIALKEDTERELLGVDLTTVVLFVPW